MLQDLVHAWRTLRRAPSYAILVATTLALGIGANSAIFNVAWQVLLKPLPFADEDRLVLVWEAYGPSREKNAVAPASFLDWQREAESLEAVAAFTGRSTLHLTGAGEPRELAVAHVTEGYFGVLGISPIAGRTILPSDAAQDGGLVVLSERLWRDAFGANPQIIGRPIRLHDESFTVLGVVPERASFGFSPTDVWVRLDLRGESARIRQAHYLQVVARLKPGVSHAGADDEVRRISERAYAQFRAPGVAESARLFPLRDELTGSVRPALLVMLAGAALVLIIACANVSGLQLARQARRRRDRAIQAALGASRRRLFSGALLEAVLVSLPAAAAGIILGAWLLVALAAAAPALAGLQIATSPGWAVLTYTFVLSIVAAVVCGAASAASTQNSLSPLLGGRGAADTRGSTRIRTVLVVLQVAVSVLVLVGGALLLTSLTRVLRVDPGFRLDEGLIVGLDLPQNAYPDAAARSRFYQRAVQRIEALPGVAGTCAMTAAPLTAPLRNLTWVAEGATRMVGSQTTSMTPTCFDVLRIPVLQGRTFADVEPEPVVILSRSLSRQLFGQEDPLGKRTHMGVPAGPLFTVVGIVGDIRSNRLETSFGNQAWLSSSRPQYPPRQLVIRTTVDGASVTAAVRAAIRELDPKLPVNRVRTVQEVRAATLAERRFNMLLLVTYGLIGLALCAVGVYGLLSETVTWRAREIGIRMALGARPADVIRSTLFSTLVSVGGGCVAGIAGAAALSSFIRSMLFQLSPTDPTIYLGVVALVMTVALLAAYLPARRAIRIDPLEALRSE